VKIATLLFLSIYSLRLRAPRFLGPHDTLPCVLIVSTVKIGVFFSDLVKTFTDLGRAKKSIRRLDTLIEGSTVCMQYRGKLLV